MLLPKYIVNFCCCLRQKVNKLIVFLEMWFQRLPGVIGYALSELLLSEYIDNYCCCLQEKANKLIVLVEM